MKVMRKPGVHRRKASLKHLPTATPNRAQHGAARAAVGPILLAGLLLSLAGTAALRGGSAAGTLNLRVVAATNRPADQAVKLQVRDAILAVLAPGLAQARSEGAAHAYVAARLSDVRLAAQTVAEAAGEPVTVRLGSAPLPARHIGILAFPAGTAPALVVTLGPGQGHNWWTVLFPPLAFVTLHGDLLVVGPGGAAEPVDDLTATQRRALLDWVAGRTHVALDDRVSPADPDSAAGAQVQVRFAVWDALQRVPWGALRGDVLAWLGAGTTVQANAGSAGGPA